MCSDKQGDELKSKPEGEEPNGKCLSLLNASSNSKTNLSEYDAPPEMYLKQVCHEADSGVAAL